MNLVGMVDNLIDQKFAFAIMHHLVHFHNPSASLIGAYLHRLHVWIKQCPLARPVVAHALMPVDEAALHSVRPDHVRTHARQNCIDPAGIEIEVCSLKQLAFVTHSSTRIQRGAAGQMTIQLHDVSGQ